MNTEESKSFLVELLALYRVISVLEEWRLCAFVVIEKSKAYIPFNQQNPHNTNSPNQKTLFLCGKRP